MISKLKQGRGSSEPMPKEFEAQLDPKQHDVMDPHKRKDKRVKIDPDDPEEMDQQSDDAVKRVTSNSEQTGWRMQKVERISLAIQQLIVNRAVAFCFGSDVELNAEPQDGTKEPDVLKAVKQVLYDTKSRTINRRIARAIFSSTEAAEMWYVVPRKQSIYGFESNYKLRCSIFSPLLGDKLYPYFDDTGDMIAFSREYAVTDANKVEHTYFEVWTDETHLLFESDEKGTYTIAPDYPKENAIHKIPIVYGRQPKVEYADVETLINRLEFLLSNFADTNDYHASPKIFVTGDVHGWAKKGETGSVIEGEPGATAQYLSWTSAPESVKLEIDTLLRMIYTITQTPDISFDSVRGIGSISGVALKLLFMDAHLKVQDKREMFDDYLQRRLSVIQAYLAQMNTADQEFVQACTTLTIEPMIKPYMIEDDASKVNVLLAANGSNAICSQKTAVQKLGWVKDADAEIDQIGAEKKDNTQALQDVMGSEGAQ